MAYPTVSAPYGLRPVNLIGGQVFAGSTRQIPIASGEGTSIFYGDVVKLVTGGTVRKDVGTDAATPVGVFLGCTYTNPSTNQKISAQYWPAATVTADATAYVCDDPDTLFKVAVVSATTTVGGVTRTAVGNNAILVQNTGSTVTGDSKIAVGASYNTTATFPVRVVDVVPETVNASGSYTEVIVKWNWGMHQYQNATGVGT
jgi:hypothetical protein